MSDSAAHAPEGVASSHPQRELLPIGTDAKLDFRQVHDALAQSQEETPGGYKDRRGYRMRRIMALADVAALCLAWGIAAFVVDAFGRSHGGREEIVAFVGFLPLWVLLGSLVGLYHVSEKRVDPSVADEAGKLVTMVTAWTWAYLLVRGAITSGPNQLLPAVVLWGASIGTLLLLRPLVRHFARQRDWYWQNTIIVGHTEDVERVSRRLARHPEYGLRVVGTFDLWERLNSGAAIPELLKSIQARGVARVIVASSPLSVKQRGRLVRELRDAGVQVDLATGAADSFAPSVMLNYLEGIPVLSVPIIERSKATRVAKRLFDVAAASVALFFLTPLFAYCAVRIKLDSKGPVFFRQRRIGKGKEPFEVFKFRSMVADAESQQESLVSAVTTDGEPSLFKMEDDPRVTRFGATMRRWSLDELPQLINVVRGEMSLVGPRPLPVDEVARVSNQLAKDDELFSLRFKVLPGMTGAWQAHGRSDIGFEDMVQLDYMYVSNWSFSEDLKLILRTVEVIMHGRGAY